MQAARANARSARIEVAWILSRCMKTRSYRHDGVRFSVLEHDFVRSNPPLSSFAALQLRRTPPPSGGGKKQCRSSFSSPIWGRGIAFGILGVWTRLAWRLASTALACWCGRPIRRFHNLARSDSKVARYETHSPSRTSENRGNLRTKSKSDSPATWGRCRPRILSGGDGGGTASANGDHALIVEIAARVFFTAMQDVTWAARICGP